uniref:Uncharacterized protein n=1 Tax=Rhodnius prolixus TaxID=13249 RepID=T1HRM0_RHOPR
MRSKFLEKIRNLLFLMFGPQTNALDGFSHYLGNHQKLYPIEEAKVMSDKDSTNTLQAHMSIHIRAHACAPKGVIGVNDHHPVMEAVRSPDWSSNTIKICNKKCNVPFEKQKLDAVSRDTGV